MCFKWKLSLLWDFWQCLPVKCHICMFYLCTCIYTCSKTKAEAQNYRSDLKMIISAFQLCFASSLYEKTTGFMLHPATGMEKCLCLDCFNINTSLLNKQEQKIPYVTKSLFHTGALSSKSIRERSIHLLCVESLCYCQNFHLKWK